MRANGSFSCDLESFLQLGCCGFRYLFASLLRLVLVSYWMACSASCVIAVFSLTGVLTFVSHHGLLFAVDRFKTVDGMHLTATFCALAALLYLLWPTRAGFHFSLTSVSALSAKCVYLYRNPKLCVYSSGLYCKIHRYTELYRPVYL